MSETIRKFIRELETGRQSRVDQYRTIIGHNEHRLAKPLTSMSIDEILESQDSWRKQFKVSSGAAGAYQVIKPTLTSAKASLKLSGSELFDEHLQDRIADWLLAKRGLADFLAGRASVAQFGNSLAKEWASFPLLAATARGKTALKRGQSYYDGVGGNSALTTPAKIELMLAQAKRAATPVLEQKPFTTNIFPSTKGVSKMNPTVNVPVKSAWTSKVNWTMALGIIFNIFALFGLDVPDDVRASIVTGGSSLFLALGWVLRTFFTTAVTPASASKM